MKHAALRSLLVLGFLLAVLPSPPAAAQERRGDLVDEPREGLPVPKDRDRIRMTDPEEIPPAPDRPAKPPAPPAAADPVADPAAAAIAGLSAWPAPAAREAAATLVLLGESVEKRLVEALVTADPATASGIGWVLGEIGGDEAYRALLALAERPSMVDRLPDVFGALGKVGGIEATARILPFLRHPKRPGRLAAEAWLADRVDASHAGALEALLGDASSGARAAALRLLLRVAPDRAREKAVSLLADPVPEIARAAAALLASLADEAGEAELNRIVATGEDRAAAYATIALALRFDRTGRPSWTPATVQTLLGRKGVAGFEKLNRGAAAVVLADVGYLESVPEVDRLLDREIVDLLLDTFGGATYFGDYNSVAELARHRFGRLTGVLDRRPVRDLWDWWKASREGFVARRSLTAIHPESFTALRVRARSTGSPELPPTLFSTDPTDGSSPDNLSIDFIYLTPADARELARTIAEGGVLALPDSLTMDPARAAGKDPELYLTISADKRSRTISAAPAAPPEPVAELLSRLVVQKRESAWQAYWDRARHPRFADFVEAETEWLQGDHPPEAAAAHRRDLILAALDDVVVPAKRLSALDELLDLNCSFSDRDAYTLALALNAEVEYGPVAERLITLLASSGRTLVLPILAEWFERRPVPEAATILAGALARMGETALRVAGASDRELLAAAAVAASPEVLSGPDLLAFLKEAIAEGTPAIRRAGLRSLGRTGDPAALPFLVAALDSREAAVWGAAIDGLGDLKRPEAVSALAGQATAEDPGRRAAAVAALCRSGLDGALDPALSVLRNDASPTVRTVAAREIVQFGARAVGGLSRIALTAGERPEVRRRAMEALIRVGGDAVQPLFLALLDDPVVAVADEAAMALATRQSKAAMPRLLDALVAGRDAIRVVGALEQITCREFPDAPAGELPVLYRGFYVEHQHETAGRWFADALVERGRPREALAGLADDRPTPAAAPVLVQALADPSWPIRANANLWLTRIAGTDFGEVTMHTPPEAVKAIAEKWRARFPDR